MKILRSVLTVCLYLVTSVPALFAVDPEELRAEFWVDPGIVLFADMKAAAFDGGEGGMTKLTRESYLAEAVRYLMEQARWTFSGMIYGFRFVYTPSDRERGVEEVYQIEPVHLLPWGDPRLTVLRSETIDGRIYVVLSYRLDRSQQIRVRGWRTAVFPSAGGMGQAPLQEDFCTLRAMEQGIKEAVRQYLRPLVYNKPKRITGVAVLQSNPVFSFAPGHCQSQVSVRLKIDEVLPHADP